MGYRAKTIDEVEPTSGRIEPRFSGSRESYRMTQLPLAVTSWALDSIDFIGIVNSRVKWDPAQCVVAPGDAVKAMIMTMVMGAYRPALENVARRYTGQPMELYFESVNDPMQLDPDMLARTLTKLHEENVPQLFATVSAALRTRWKIVTKAAHSDTSSVSVQGEYENGYDGDGNVTSTAQAVAVPMSIRHRRCRLPIVSQTSHSPMHVEVTFLPSLHAIAPPSQGLVFLRPFPEPPSSGIPWYYGLC